LRQALAEKDGLIATERRIAADLQIRAAVSETRVAELEALSRKQTAEIESLRGELHTTCAKISATEVEHGLLRIEHGELLARTQRVRALVDSSGTSALITMTNRVAPPSTADLARSDAGALRAGIAEREARIQELTRKLDDSESRAAGLDTQLLTWKHRIAPLVLQLRIQRERNRKLRQLLRAEDPPAAPAAGSSLPADNRTDDLKQIRGIGPSIERKLHSQGIFRFRQLAELNPMELATIAARLSIPSTKPWRDRWIEQARALSERSNAA
jgi:NADH-quinone oxidoreductase subunit E